MRTKMRKLKPRTNEAGRRRSKSLHHSSDGKRQQQRSPGERSPKWRPQVFPRRGEHTASSRRSRLRLRISLWAMGALYNQSVSGICYAVNGDTIDLTVCDATATVSRCCSPDDFCVDNGLCLDAGSDNLWSVQGCTDYFWKGPCRKYCNSSFINEPLSGLYTYIHICGEYPQVGGAEMGACCTHDKNDASCCQDPDARFPIPKFHQAPYRPGHVAGAGSETNGNNQSNSITLGIGLGAIFVAMLVGIWQIWEARRAQRRMEYSNHVELQHVERDPESHDSLLQHRSEGLHELARNEERYELEQP
ncbi:MAG: hypothetical protein M1816_008099 [Peltula sp. TS41687]|nr:MAG: hypothetical protein M1816_008099 [Peltula sp. TS41687]